MQRNLEFLTKTFKFIWLDQSQCRSKLSLTSKQPQKMSVERPSSLTLKLTRLQHQFSDLQTIPAK